MMVYRVRDRDWNWNRNLVMLLTDVLYNVFTFMVISCLLNHFVILKALSPGSFITNLPWSLSDGSVTFLLDSRVTPRLDLFPVLHFFCWLANGFQHLLAKFSYSLLIASSLTALLNISRDLPLCPCTWVIPLCIALVCCQEEENNWLRKIVRVVGAFHIWLIFVGLATS